MSAFLQDSPSRRNEKSLTSSQGQSYGVITSQKSVGALSTRVPRREGSIKMFYKPAWSLSTCKLLEDAACNGEEDDLQGPKFGIYIQVPVSICGSLSIKPSQ
jgi:hypothetical protein